MKMTIKGAIAVCASVALLGLAAGGCTPKSLCKKIADCEGYDKEDEKICVIQMKAQKDIAAVYGCKAEYNAAMACFNKEGECDTSYGYDEFTDGGACNSEWRDYYDCTDEYDYSYYDGVGNNN